MNPIKTQFNAEGHFLRQIWRRGDVAVYERSLSPKDKPHELEMVIIQIAPEQKMQSGVLAPEREMYPSASKWGRLGWSFPIRDKEWVLSLALQCCSISRDRAAIVREAAHRKWLARTDW